MQTALRSAFPIDARRLDVLAALVLAMVQARTVVLYALKSHVHLPGALDMRDQWLRRFLQFQLPDGMFTQFAPAILPAGDLELILDRTNWKLGQQDVNILLLSAVWSGFSLPLMWIVLPHGGSSSQVLREALLTRFLSVCPDRKITGLKSRPGVRRKDLVRLSRPARDRPLYSVASSCDGWNQHDARLGLL